MTYEEVKKVAAFAIEKNSRILIVSPFVDGFASVSYNNGHWSISSPVIAEQPLENVRMIDLRFFKEVQL